MRPTGVAIVSPHTAVIVRRLSCLVMKLSENSRSCTLPSPSGVTHIESDCLSLSSTKSISMGDWP